MPGDQYKEIFDEVEELKSAERKRLLASKEEEADPADYPASRIVTFRWYDRVLGRTVSEPFELRLLDYRERMQRSRTVGLMAQISWNLLPEDTQQYLLAVATSNILWPNASEAWKRALTEREEIAIQAYMAVEGHRQEYFRGGDVSGGKDEIPMGLDILPVSTP